jgi:hypothetical protein
MVGAVAVRTAGTYGHVAYVEAVEHTLQGPSIIAVAEYNKRADGNYGERQGTAAQLGFSYFVHFEDFGAGRTAAVPQPEPLPAAAAVSPPIAAIPQVAPASVTAQDATEPSTKLAATDVDIRKKPSAVPAATATTKSAAMAAQMPTAAPSPPLAVLADPGSPPSKRVPRAVSTDDSQTRVPVSAAEDVPFAPAPDASNAIAALPPATTALTHSGVDIPYQPQTVPAIILSAAPAALLTPAIANRAVSASFTLESWSVVGLGVVVLARESIWRIAAIRRRS